MSLESERAQARQEGPERPDGAEPADGDSPLGAAESPGLPPSESHLLSELDPEDLVVLDDRPESRAVPAGPRPRRISKGRRGRQRVPAAEARRRTYTAEQRLLILDTWSRSGLPAKDFAPLVGVSNHSLYAWRKKFERQGPAGLEDKPRAAGGSRLSDVTKRAILLMKRTHPDWGQDRIHDMLKRSAGLQASPGAIGRLLDEEGYVVVEERTRPHPDKPRRFERATPNDLWQTDLFTFKLKRQNRTVHLVIFMDDNSRFVVGYGLHASASGALVREVFEAAIANYGAPREVLTDNGSQYVTWRGKSAFTKLCERRGIKQVVARPRRPQTLGKAERFWGSLWRECIEAAVFLDFNDARTRIGLYLDHYNFHRTHRGIGGLVPADRFFLSAAEVKKTLAERVASNALELARDGLPRKDFYLTGRVGDVGISLHAEGQQVVLTREDGTREEVNLSATGRRGDNSAEQSLPLPVAVSGPPTLAVPEAEPAPGTSPLDEGLALLDALADPGAESVDALAADGGDGEVPWTDGSDEATS